MPRSLRFFVTEEDVAHLTAMQRSKVSGISSTGHHWYEDWAPCCIPSVSPLYQVSCLTLHSTSSLPPSQRLISPSIPRGGEGSGEDFRAAGGDRLSVPSTYTNGRISAPHKNN